MSDYEIRYLHGDGSLSLVYKTVCDNDAGARRAAQKMLPANCARYEIWSENMRVGDDTERQSAA
jgi:hypothetical protein